MNWWVLVIAWQLANQRQAPAPIFPIPGPPRAGTPFVDGKFGAFRPGKRPAACGKGHCGLDLHAPDGTPVLAIYDGKVDQVERSDRGNGGRWVRLMHEDGRATWYMHLAEVRADLVRGLPIKAGEEVGTLGRTGVRSSPTHLHFAITVGSRPDGPTFNRTPLNEPARAGAGTRSVQGLGPPPWGARARYLSSNPPKNMVEAPPPRSL